MAEIVRLWREERLPIKDAVYFADGRSYAVDVVHDRQSVVEYFADGRSYAIDIMHGHLSVVEQFDLVEVLADDPDWMTTSEPNLGLPRI